MMKHCLIAGYWVTSNITISRNYNFISYFPLSSAVRLRHIYQRFLVRVDTSHTSTSSPWILMGDILHFTAHLYIIRYIEINRNGRVLFRFSQACHEDLLTFAVFQIFFSTITTVSNAISAWLPRLHKLSSGPSVLTFSLRLYCIVTPGHEPFQIPGLLDHTGFLGYG